MSAPQSSPQASAKAPGLRWPDGRTWADLTVLLLLSVLGLIGFVPSFGGYSFVLPALGGLLVGFGTALMASALRLSVIATVLASVAGYFLLGTPFAVPQQGFVGVLPSLDSLTSLAVGAVFGWADIVTLATPIGAPQYIAVVPYVATWLVVLVSTSLAARWLSARPRTAWRFAVTLIGPVALYLASILIGTDDPFQAGLRGVTFAALALVWLGWRRRPIGSVSPSGARSLRNRKLAGTAVVVVGAVLLGGGIGFVAAPAHEQRFVLRDEIQPPFDPLQYPSPLAGFRHYTKQVTDEVLFTVEGLAPGDVVRLATLDSFTGKLWTVTGPQASTEGSGSFALVGRTMPRTDFVTGTQRTGVTFTMAAYDDVWMPSLGYPNAVAFTGGAAVGETDTLRYNTATGTAVLAAGLREGDSYTIDAMVQNLIPLADLAEVGIAPVELPPVEAAPDIVTAKAQEFAGSTTAPAAQLEAIRLALAGGGFLSHGRASDSVASRAGHGADRVSELLERTQMVGDQEQYASTFALMARSFGYPARVVMGFAPTVEEGQREVEVTGDDVTAWVEVAFEGIGWVAFDPTPEQTDIPQDQTPKPQSEPQPQVRQPPPVENDSEDLLSPVELDESDKEDQDLVAGIPGWVWVVGASVLVPLILIFGPLLVVAAIKSRRAGKRRRAAAAHDGVAGAWDELVDQYSELGYSVPGVSTRLRVAEHLQGQLAPPAPETVVPGSPSPLLSLARTTDEAVFSGVEVSPERSTQAWGEARAAVALGRAGVSGGRRLLARYRIRSARDWAARLSGGSR